MNKLIKIRIMCDSEVVEEAADLIAAALQSQRFELQERTDPYHNRPPQDDQSRVYLTLLIPLK